MMMYSRSSTAITTNHCKSVSYSYLQHYQPYRRVLQAFKIMIVVWMARITGEPSIYANALFVCNDANGDGTSGCAWDGGSPLTIAFDDGSTVTFGAESYLLAVCAGSLFSVSSCSCAIVVNPADVSNLVVDDFCNSCSFSLITSTAFAMDSWDCTNRLSGDCPLYTSLTGCIPTDSIAPTPEAAPMGPTPTTILIAPASAVAPMAPIPTTTLIIPAPALVAMAPTPINGPVATPPMVPVVVPVPLTGSPTRSPLIMAMGTPSAAPMSSPTAINRRPQEPFFMGVGKMKNGIRGYMYTGKAMGGMKYKSGKTMGNNMYTGKAMGGMKYKSGKTMGNKMYYSYQHSSTQNGGIIYGKAKVMNIFAYFNP
jgi:hypothetical protein